MKYCHPQLKREQGFTLLELLVVIVIFAILASMTALAIRSNPEGKLKEEAQRIRALLDLAQQESMLNNKLMAMEVGTHEYSFLVFEEDEKGEEAWLPIENNRALRQRQLSKDIELSITFDEGMERGGSSDAEEDDSLFNKDNIWILTSGELSPFTLDISMDDVGAYTLKGDLMGGLTLTSTFDDAS